MSAFDDYLNAAPAASGPQSFNDYLASTQASAAATSASPSSSPDAPGMLASFGAGLGHGVGSMMLGGQQLIGKGLQAAGNDASLEGQILAGLPATAQSGPTVPERAGRWLVKNAEQGLKNLDTQVTPYQQANPNTTAVGNFVGQAAPTLAMGPMAPGWAGASLGGRIGWGALEGAAGGALQPVSPDDPSYLQTKLEQMGIGTAAGGAIPVGLAAARGIGQSVEGVLRPILQPGRYVGEGLAGSMSAADASAAAQSIRGSQNLVPGSMPTTAQVVATPAMVQTEKALANTSPNFKTALEQLSNDNNQARWNVINNVAQTPAELAQAQAARTAAAGPLYDAAHMQSVQVTPQIAQVMQRPAVQQAMRDANTLGLNEGNDTSAWWPTAQNPAISGQALDYTHRALNDMIGTAQRAGNTQQARALLGAQSQLRNFAEQNIPEQAQAAQAYRAMSVPVNTMEAGQQIADALGSRAANSAGAPQITLTGYNTALQRALRNADYGIDVGAQNALEGVGQDLQRSTVSNSIRSPGSDTAYNLAAQGWLARNLYGPQFQGASTLGKGIGIGLASMAGHPVAGTAAVLGGSSRLGQMIGNRLQDRLGGLLLDPESFLSYLDSRAAATGQPVNQALANGLLRYGNPAAPIGALELTQNSPNKR